MHNDSYLSHHMRIFKDLPIKSKYVARAPQQKRVIYKREQINLYVADQQTYEPLILIRTGSAEHNIKLSSIALRKGMKLTHHGLIRDGKVIASTEKGIFEALGMDFVEPEQRD